MSTLTALISGGSPIQEGGIPVNSVQRFELNGQVLYTDEYDQEWLKSGSIIFPSSPSEYPYAVRTSAGLQLATNTTVATAAFGQSTGEYMQFSTDGTKLYISDNAYAISPYASNSQRSAAIHQYSLSTPFDITTKTPDNKLLDTRGSAPTSSSTSTTRIAGFSFSANGTKIYITWRDNQTTYQYTLSTAWDISTASYNNKNIVADANGQSPYGLYVKEDGTRLYVVGYNSNSAEYQISQYNFGTSYDISTISFAASRTLTAQYGSIFYGLTFSNDGTKCYAVAATNVIYQYNLSTAWAINTATYSNNSFSAGTNTLGLAINSSGTKFYGVSNNGWINVYNISTAYNIATSTWSNVEFYAIKTTSNGAAKIALNGTAVYIPQGNNYLGPSNTNTNVIFKFILTTPYDLTTMAYDSYGNISDMGSAIMIYINEDGTKLYAAPSTGGAIRQYSLTTPGDLSTLVYDNISVTIATGTAPASLGGIFISPDGTSMWLGTRSTSTLGSVYTLTTPYDISTYQLVLNFPSYPFTNVAFNDEGTVLIMQGWGGEFYSFTLNTPYKTTGGYTYTGVLSPTANTLDGPGNSGQWGIIYSSSLARFYFMGIQSDDRALMYGWNYSPIKIGVTTSSGTLDYIRIN